MKNINSVVIAGNLVSDAEFNGVACRFAVAVSSNTKNGDEFENYPNYVDCEIYGNFGEAMVEKLVKGTKVVVDGELHQDRWTADDGSTRSKLVVRVHNIERMVVRADDAEDEEAEEVVEKPKPAKKACKKR